MHRVLLRNIGLLQTPLGTEKVSGRRQGNNQMLRNATVFMVDGIIRGIYTDGVCPLMAVDEVIDAQGKLVTPGLVDCHTHLVFGGWRQHEIPLKLAGASYLDILRAGGGILNTLKSTREASKEVLTERAKGFLDDMLSLGVTSCEIKSGYGLSLAEEEKQLQVIQKLQKEHPMDIVSTFMGAHAVPQEYKAQPDAYVDLVCNEMLSMAANYAAYCDVFCEDGVFSVEQSRRILKKAAECGLSLKIHADEIEEMGGAALAGELSAVSAEHLIATGENGIRALAEGGVIADLLPQTSFYLDKPFARARQMIEAGVPVAIASDFNPGSCPSYNLQFAINLAMLRYRMTPQEILSAVTLNAACSIGLSDKLGTVEIGKQADLLVWDAKDFDLVCYRFGSNLVNKVIKKGRLVRE